MTTSNKSWPTGDEESEFHIYCRGWLENCTKGPRERAFQEAMGLVAYYAQHKYYGKVSVFEVMRREIEIPSASSAEQANSSSRPIAFSDESADPFFAA